MASAGRFEALPRFVGGSHGAIDFLGDPLHALLIDRQKHLFLRLKVVVDGAGEHPNFFCDVAHRSGVKTTLVEELRGGVQKLDTPVILTGRA